MIYFTRVEVFMERSIEKAKKQAKANINMDKQEEKNKVLKKEKRKNNG